MLACLPCFCCYHQLGCQPAGGLLLSCKASTLTLLRTLPACFLAIHAVFMSADEGLMLRPVDVRTTGTTQYEDPLHVDEAIVFYRVTLDPALRELGGN
jgi:hypothetical protein